MAKNRSKKGLGRRRTACNDIYFFCDNCSAMSPSKRHKVTLTSEGVEIVRDLCAECGVEQEIEGVEPERVETFRVRSDETGKYRNQA